MSDRLLLERFEDRCRETAEAAFAGLVERHGPMVLRVCHAVLGDRHEAEDAFQATFLVLAIRARAIRQGDSVGPWLHGVALRVAHRARWRAARRRYHELRRAEIASASGANETGGGAGPADDVAHILHQEIARLPEKLRSPLVLCYLEGLTHDQAAAQLGWPVGTVHRRLAGARGRLHGRLSRRGVAPSCLPSAILGSGPSGDPAALAISVPSRLTNITVRGALDLGPGQAASAGIASGDALSLTMGVLRTLTIAKWTTTAAAVLTTCLVAAVAGFVVYQGERSGTLATRQENREKAIPASDPTRSADDQLDAILRQWDATVEENQRSAIAPMTVHEKETLAQANVAQLKDVRTRMQELAFRYPRTNAAEQALIWIVTHNSRYSTETNRAWELLARDYARSDRIKQILSRQRLMFQWASQAVEDLLRNTLEQNPYREIRGQACYWLAETLTNRAQFLRNWPVQPPRLTKQWREEFSPQDLDRVLKQAPKDLETQAARLYERIIADFPMVPNNDSRCGTPPQILGRAAIQLPEVAKVHLDALRRLSPGEPAPAIEGIDLDGRSMRLSDFRGKVVVLLITGFETPFAYPPERGSSYIAELFRQVARSAAGRPVALLGVIENHREIHKKEAQATGLPIRLWWDPEIAGSPEIPRLSGSRPGPIHAAWDAEVPNWYVIDTKGVIRFTNLFGHEMLEKAIATLLSGHDGAPDQAK